MFGIYLHVPFCTTRCGYCDFNTYTPGELGSVAGTDAYLQAIERELSLADTPEPAQTVFVGGGTPTLLGTDLPRLLDMVREYIGLADGAEITTEANPESVSPKLFELLLEAGFTRVSLGMQSASASVLKVLERRHTPGRAVAAAKEALDVGFEHVNLDMIYGTPTETDEDVLRTLEAILSTEVDHVSAYSLIVEEGTAMARKVRRGELPQPEEDTYADRYELISRVLAEAGFEWYEVSNWAKPGGQCEHNLIYWRGGQWWGAGPGAHSAIGHRRFSNVKYPARYYRELSENRLPIAESEELTPAELHTEALMTGLRLREGIPAGWINAAGQAVVERYARAGLLRHEHGRVEPTERGRFLIDGIIVDIAAAEES